MKAINEYIDEQFNPEWDYIVEMANIGYPCLNKETYNISVHGLNAGERIKPHFHIYLANDKRPFTKFNIEIALDELLCYDELNIIRFNNGKTDKTNRNKCSWEGYNKLKNDFEDWLYDKSDKRGDYIDNLDALIYYYNEESGGETNDNNPLLNYIKKQGLKVLGKFKKYFNEKTIENYKDCF